MRIFASEASSVTNCANLRFLVYIFIYLYIIMYVAVRPFWSRTGPPATRKRRTGRLRFKGQYKEERLCPSCNVIEDEQHFLIDCSIYNGNERRSMMDICTALKRSFPHYSSKEKFIFILSTKNTQLLWNLGQFVYTNFMKRLHNHQ